MPTYAFFLFDSNGNPLAGATPTFVSFLNAVTGAVITAPANPTEAVPGIYVFDADPSGSGFAFMVDGGVNAVPRYVGGGAGANGVVVMPCFENDGTPRSTATVSFQNFADPDGTPRPQPAINNLGAGLSSFVPNAGDISASAIYSTSTNGQPSYYMGRLSSENGGVTSTGANFNQGFN